MLLNALHVAFEVGQRVNLCALDGLDFGFDLTLHPRACQPRAGDGFALCLLDVGRDLFGRQKEGLYADGFLGRGGVVVQRQKQVGFDLVGHMNTLT